jgi:hypothetical protein
MSLDGSNEKKTDALREEAKPSSTAARENVVAAPPEQELFKAAKLATTNASDGSLMQYQPTGRQMPADWQQQNESIELFDERVVVSRTKPGNESIFQRSKEEPQKIAYDIKDFQRDAEKAWVNVGEPLLAKTEESWDKLSGGSVSMRAAESAYDAFPQLAEHGLPRRIVAALILNEVRHRKPKDPYEDALVGMFGKVVDVRHGFKDNPDASIGPGQIQVRNIRELAQHYDQLKKFPDPVRAALDPGKAPYFVAAYLVERISWLQAYNAKHEQAKVPINDGTLFYLYNPDVVVKHGVANPTPDDFRALTGLEKAERSVTRKKPESQKDWDSVQLPINPVVVQKSSVVREMRDALRAVEQH